MTLEQTIDGVIERTIADTLADRRFRDLRAGRMPRQALHTFARHFIITHLNSVQVLSFLHALAPPPQAWTSATLICIARTLRHYSNV